jgi:predicted  nucleic acid-binding Zn-ribbon protein
MDSSSKDNNNYSSGSGSGGINVKRQSVVLDFGSTYGAESRFTQGDVEQIVTRITRDEARLSSGASAAKELEQLQHELGTLGARRSELEEVELEIMMRVDGIKARIDELKNQESEFALEIANLEIRKENALTVISVDLEAIAQDRARTISSIDKALVELYEKIKSNNNGTGAAALVGNQCKGCHLTINTVELQRISGLPDDELVRCEECRCILVRDH